MLILSEFFFCCCKCEYSHVNETLSVQIANLSEVPIHQAKPNISVPGWGLTSHGMGSPNSLEGWTLEGKVALLVTPQNAKAAIMQSGIWCCHECYFYILLLWTGNTQSSFTRAEIRLQWEVSSNAKLQLFIASCSISLVKQNKNRQSYVSGNFSFYWWWHWWSGNMVKGKERSESCNCNKMYCINHVP